MRFCHSFQLRRRREQESSSHFPGLFPRTTSKKTFELSVEMGGAFVADLRSCSCNCGVVPNHQQSGLMQPDGFDVLDWRCSAMSAVSSATRTGWTRCNRCRLWRDRCLQREPADSGTGNEAVWRYQSARSRTLRLLFATLLCDSQPKIPSALQKQNASLSHCPALDLV